MIEKILVRAPAELKDALVKRAKRIGVSMNALILRILWDWIERDGR